MRLADAAFHLQLDQPVHFHGVFHRQLFHKRLDEAVDDHRAGFGFGQAAALQVEKLFFADPRDARLVADLNVLLFDFDVRIGIAAALRIENQRVADDVALAAGGALFDLAPSRGSWLRPPFLEIDFEMMRLVVFGAQ